MSEPNESQNPLGFDLRSIEENGSGAMTEDLRSRIAAALYRIYPPYQLGYSFGHSSEQWENESEQCKDVYRRDADAVIRDVLTPEFLADLMITAVQKAANHE